MSFLLSLRASVPAVRPLSRAYSPHRPQLLTYRNVGRSVPVRGLSPALAYFQLKEILAESKVRETVRFQEWFESKPDKRRRKRKEADWRKYLEHVKQQVVLAQDLAWREKVDKQNYIDI
ncbi:hypothetical protein BDR26DRAFT_869121 [Obelidium mucronatum]|nr:hypothetical protein BDR26DRAFT_869121 [Obelidium mucronatum]